MEDGSVLPYVCLQRERNNQSFEDCEQTVVELKDFFFTLASCFRLPSSPTSNGCVLPTPFPFLILDISDCGMEGKSTQLCFS